MLNKTKLLVYCGLSIIFFSSLYSQSIIIDHTCRDINRIPIEYINQIKNMFLVHTGGSHGFQVPQGLEKLENQNSYYSVGVNEEDYPLGNGIFKVSRSVRNQYNKWKSSVSPDDYWDGEAAMDNVRRTLDYYVSQGIKVDAILHTWCWHMRTASESYVKNYFSAMETFESEYPDVTFIYMTDTCDREGSDGYNRWLRHQQIRNYCQSHNKILFDFAELESWSADGNHQQTTTYNNVTFPYWHDDWSEGEQIEYGHINEAGTIMKAKAIWWLMARLAGWQPGVTPVELVLFEGTVVEDGIKLIWKTASERNNYGFEIERSIDSSQFESIAFIIGNATAAEPKVYHFIDKNPSANILYYRLKQIDFNGKINYSSAIKVETAGQFINLFTLYQNYPNPFNPLTNIPFSLQSPQQVTLKVYDLLGKEITTLINELKPSGYFNVTFDASDYCSGEYFYKLKAGNNSEIRRMVLVK